MFLRVLVFVLIFNITTICAQVGIGTTTPHPSSILDISSTNSGLLIPRVKLLTDGDDSGINKPATGLLVFNINVTNNLHEGFYYWNGKKWQPLQEISQTSEPDFTGDVWKLSGNANTNKNKHFIGTTDWQSLNFRVRNENFATFGTNGSIKLGYEANIGEDDASYRTAIGYRSKNNANHSFAVGTEATTNGEYAYSLGNKANADANHSYAIGKEAVSNNQNSYAIGHKANSAANSSYAIGEQAKTNAQNSYAIGYKASTNHNNSYAIGNEAKANGYISYAIGDKALATTNNAFAIGNNATASGQQAIAIGYNAVASQNNAIVIGNTDSTTKIGIGTSNPDEKLHVAGSIKIVDGTQGTNKVLTSDANGKGSWKNISDFNANIYGDLILNSEVTLNNEKEKELRFSLLKNNGVTSYNGVKTNTPGQYLVTYTITLENNKSNKNTKVEVWLSNSKNKIDNTSIRTSMSSDEIKTIALSRIIDINSSDEIFVHVKQHENSASVKVLKEGTNMLVQKI